MDRQRQRKLDARARRMESQGKTSVSEIATKETETKVVKDEVRSTKTKSKIAPKKTTKEKATGSTKIIAKSASPTKKHNSKVKGK